MTNTKEMEQLKIRLTRMVRGRRMDTVFATMHLLAAMLEEAASTDLSRDDQCEAVLDTWRQFHSALTPRDLECMTHLLYDAYDRRLLLGKSFCCFL